MAMSLFKFLNYKFIINMLCFFFFAPQMIWAAHQELSHLVVSTSLEHAKTLLMQGHRQEALAQFNQLLQTIQSKKERKQIALKRRLFMEQFLTSDDFQAYQEAKEFAEVKRWPDCLQGINLIKIGDQDNLKVLELKTVCQRNLNQLDQAEQTIKMILSMDSKYCLTQPNECPQVKKNQMVKHSVVKK